jgi:hypothetical protein
MTLFCLGYKSNQILILILIGSNSASLSLQYYLSIAKGMQKKILIPIDFRIESLNTLKYALEERKQEKSTIILMYSAYISDSITELLFYDPAKITKALASTDFNDAIAIISNTYESSLHSIEIELFNGINKNAFLNFYEAHGIDLIYLPKDYCLKPHKNGFDPIPLIKKSNVEYKEVAWASDRPTTNKDALTQLFK